LLVKIANFKSVESAELELAPVTILVGPPASGKSNILDAIALAGYFNRIMLLDKEYDNNATLLEPLTLIARFNTHEQLFTRYDLTRKIYIELQPSEDERLTVELQFKQGKFEITVNDTLIPWDLMSALTTPRDTTGSAVRNALSQAMKGKLLVEARLYGYDRYGLASTQCTTITLCGFNMRMKGLQLVAAPKNLLSEFGWNAPKLTKLVGDIVGEVEDVLREHLDIGVEIRITLAGTIMIFDGRQEVELVSVSDSVFRVLYYLMAIKTAVNYAKLYGLERRFILMLEEPEAHVFPYYLDTLAEYIGKAKDYLYVVVATHNPLLVSMLWDKVRDLKTYYVAREKMYTRVWELDVGRLAEDLRTAEDLLYMSPREVASRYVVGAGGGESSGMEAGRGGQ